MKGNIVLVLSFLLISVLLTASMALAAPQIGLLVDNNGAPLKGYSNVYIENGTARPVYDSDTNLWYTVFVTGKAADGTLLCTLGHPMGVDSAASNWEDSSVPGPAAEPDNND